MANLLTGLRLLLILPVSWGLALPGAINPLMMLGMITIAIMTDIFDGKIARAQGSASSRGMLFDHATDFLFVTCGLFALAYQGVVSPLLPLLIIIAFTQYVLDSYFLHRQKQLHMSFLGRWNGVLYFVPLVSAAMVAVVAAASAGRGIDSLLTEFTTWFAYLLQVSTVASIVDRSIAPLRFKESS